MLDLREKIVGVAVLCVALSSEALTLGRIRGAALIGQPLDLAVQVQMDAGEDAASLCFDAEVFHADSRQDGNRVRVVVEPSAQAPMANVRVISSSVVDEPVVTLYLRTGCGQKISRRYVLLAEFPSDLAAASLPTAAQFAPASTASPGRVGLTPIALLSTVTAKTVREPKQTVRRQAAQKSTELKAAFAPTPRVMSKEKSQTERSAGRSRLTLDPLELLSDRVANLESSIPVALSEDALRSMQKMQALEDVVKAGLALAAKNEAALVDLKARLQKAEAALIPTGLLYGLIALMLSCLAAVALLWSRQRRIQLGSEDWWSGSAAMPALPDTALGPLSMPGAIRKELGDALVSTKTSATAVSQLASTAAPSSEVDVSMVEMSESSFAHLMQSGVAHTADRKLSSSPLPLTTVVVRTGLAHRLNSEAVSDIRQQAEFLISLGQFDRAVRILKKQIHESHKPNPFVYLDLLDLFHSRGLNTDFQQFREDFNLLFTGKVPEFAFFKEEGRGLESYPDVLSHITQLWSTPKVPEVIERSIFQDMWETKNQSFDLAAFRDLLLLHAVAQSVFLTPHPQRAEPKVDSWPGAAAPASPPLHLTLDAVVPPRVLDLDLSDPELVASSNDIEMRRKEAPSTI